MFSLAFLQQFLVSASAPFLISPELMTTCEIQNGEATTLAHNIYNQPLRLEPEVKVVYFAADSKVKKVMERTISNVDLKEESSLRLFSTKNIPKDSVTCAVVPKIAK